MDEKRDLLTGARLLGVFVLLTSMIQCIDVRAVGPNGTKIGFATFNVWFHKLTGVNMTLYTITDWLGLVPIFICMCFGVLGLVQLLKRRSLRRVDTDIILLGLYYVLVIACYLIFEMIPINYRPVLIEGRLEASYPSSTTLSPWIKTVYAVLIGLTVLNGICGAVHSDETAVCRGYMSGHSCCKGMAYRKGKEFIMNSNDYTIRLEKEEDHRAVENLVREAFWNVYRPGCSEHYVIHVLRDDPAFVKELDLVMEKDGKLIGQNMFMKTVIESDDGRTIPVLTMGPICITPELKRKGYGKAMLDHSLKKAAGMGFGAVLFEGNIDFYGKSGFDYAGKFGIRYHGLPEDADASFFLCKELIPGYLDDVTGVYQTPQGYYVKDEEVEEFDKEFPPKEKLKLPGQIFR